MTSFQSSPVGTKFLVIAVVTMALAWPMTVDAQAPNYQGKTITIVQRDPGGTGDMRVRAMLPYLKKHIPGNPNIVMEDMPGGGSRKAVNHVFQSTVTDGLLIGNLSSGTVSAAVLKVPENHERAIQEIPREPEVVEIFKQIIGAGPLPPRR